MVEIAGSDALGAGDDLLDRAGDETGEKSRDHQCDDDNHDGEDGDVALKPAERGELLVEGIDDGENALNLFGRVEDHRFAHEALAVGGELDFLPLLSGVCFGAGIDDGGRAIGKSGIGVAR